VIVKDWNLVKAITKMVQVFFYPFKLKLLHQSVEADKVAKNLVTVLDAHKKTVTAIEIMIQREVKNASTYISSLRISF
jgi:hypothetical protein